VTWAQQRVPSGLAALLVAMTPLWMTLLEWLRPGGARPSRGVVAGLATGFAGVAFLVRPGSVAGAVDPAGAAALMLACLCWATGSLYSRGARLPASPLVATAMEMLAGGALLLVAAALHGELLPSALAWPSPRSLAAFAYLVVFGSLVAFSAYIWLLRVTTPARVSTYAYVNPVVAVFLGWAVAGEPLTARTLAGAAVIVASVALITSFGAARPAPGAAAEGGAAPATCRAR
jgi:drug/metabolite transporter (DMT)-like permease